MVAGREVTPKDAEAVERLRRWATEGEGAAHFRWGEPGDFDRCVRFYTDKMSPTMVKGWCSRLHKRATGAWPGRAPGEEALRRGHGDGHPG